MSLDFSTSTKLAVAWILRLSLNFFMLQVSIQNAVDDQVFVTWRRLVQGLASFKLDLFAPFPHSQSAPHFDPDVASIAIFVNFDGGLNGFVV